MIWRICTLNNLYPSDFVIWNCLSIFLVFFFFSLGCKPTTNHTWWPSPHQSYHHHPLQTSHHSSTQSYSHHHQCKSTWYHHTRQDTKGFPENSQAIPQCFWHSFYLSNLPRIMKNSRRVIQWARPPHCNARFGFHPPPKKKHWLCTVLSFVMVKPMSFPSLLRWPSGQRQRWIYIYISIYIFLLRVKNQHIISLLCFFFPPRQIQKGYSKLKLDELEQPTKLWKAHWSQALI